MRTLTAITLAASLAACGSSPPADTSLMRGGKWQITVDVVDFHAPAIAEPDRQKIMGRMKSDAAIVNAEGECRPEKTAANWLKPGDAAPGFGALSCRYTKVERPGQPADRTVECLGPDKKVAATSRSTGTVGQTSYELRVETSNGKGAGSVVIERGKWVGACELPN